METQCLPEPDDDVTDEEALPPSQRPQVSPGGRTGGSALVRSRSLPSLMSGMGDVLARSLEATGSKAARRDGFSTLRRSALRRDRAFGSRLLSLSAFT